MGLLRVQNDYLAMHCGGLLYSVAFHEARNVVLKNNCLPRMKEEPLINGEPPPEPCSPSEASKEWDNLSGEPDLKELSDSQYISPRSCPLVPILSSETDPDARIDQSIESLPSSLSSATAKSTILSDWVMFPKVGTPSQSQIQQGIKYLFPPLLSLLTLSRASPSHSFSPPYGHVSRQGYETISVTLHGTTGLPPPVGDGGVPLPFAIVSIGEDDSGRTQGVTHCPLQPTHSPSWEETISLEILDVKIQSEDVVINVAHFPSKELLAHYQLPLRYLEPFQHYHLELVQPHRVIPSGVRLYVTVLRKFSLLPRLPCFSFTGFEVLLQCMDSPLKDPVGPLLAVARIVAEYDSYRDTMLLCEPRAAGVCVMSVPFPHPLESAFTVTALCAQGQPQVSHLGLPEVQPVWNHCFLFLGRECAAVFTAGAALALEFYSTTSVMNNRGWHMQRPVAFSAFSLDHQLYRSLMSARGQRGLRLQGLPLEGCSFQTTSEAPPSVSLVLRVIGSELQKDGYDLPAYDALAQILSEYHHILNPKPKVLLHSKGEPEEQKKKTQKSSELNQTFEIQTPHERLPVPVVQGDDQLSAEITEHQTKELENYRTAMNKMAEDILALRSQVASLDTENSQLRSELSLHQDLGRTLLDDTDIDVMTKTEITDRIISLKFKLASESSTLTEQREKIQQLQNELIRKNDSEKQLVRLQQAHQQQQAVLQRYQGRLRKVADLEDTVRQQEKVIEKMEKILDTKLRERNKENTERKRTLKKQKDQEESTKREIESALAAENSRLREELEKLRNQPPPVIIQQPAQIQQSFGGTEKLMLLGQLERAEASIHTLHKQLEENARQWGKEKQEMLMRLSEYEHGFARTSTMILHNLPLKSVSDSILGRVRHRQLDPLK